MLLTIESSPLTLTPFICGLHAKTPVDAKTVCGTEPYIHYVFYMHAHIYMAYTYIYVIYMTNDNL